MGMTIDEIIAKETEIAQEFQEIIDTHMLSEDMSLEEMYCDDTELIEEKLKRFKELSDYHNQIADTLTKYQKIQEIVTKWQNKPKMKFVTSYYNMAKITEVIEYGSNYSYY